MATFSNIARSTAIGYIRLDTSAWDILLLEAGGKIELEVEGYDAFNAKTDRSSATFSNPSRTSASWTNISLS